jgi:hypothetical protein
MLFFDVLGIIGGTRDVLLRRKHLVLNAKKTIRRIGRNSYISESTI